MKKHFLEFFPEDFTNFLVENNYQKFRSKQIYNWFFEKNMNDFSQMKNIPKNLRVFLNENIESALPEIVQKQVSIDGTT